MSNTIGTNVSLSLDVEHLLPHELVNQLLEHAAELGASDLFFCTNEGHVAIFGRHLGMLRRISVLPAETGRHCLSHIKTMASMDPNERRRPLDGRWIYQRSGGEIIDLRIETVPTLYGEDLALRFFDRNSRLLAMENLGLAYPEYQLLQKLLQNPGGGLILVTGPTGSGKTTTLYALLNYLNNGERKIHTIEDPVEYALPGIRQSQVNHKVGVDFPELLRAILRQGPDVIMLGEVRDSVTAEAAVRAANCGRLVLATLHASSAAGAVQSMLGFGVLPRYLAGSLRATVAQRLVRTLCPACKKTDNSTEKVHLFKEIEGWRTPGPEWMPFRPMGCPNCHQTGFSTRSGIFEVLPVTDSVRHLIATGQSTEAIHGEAAKDGMVPLFHAGLLKVAAGETSFDEVFRVVPSESTEQSQTDVQLPRLADISVTAMTLERVQQLSPS